MTTKESSSLNSIQVLRGISILLVLLFHTQIALFHLGYLGVDIFFWISGFVLMPTLKSFWGKNPNLITAIRNFYLKRFYRLVPALSFTLSIFGVLIFFLGNALDLLKIAQQEFATIFLAGNVGAFFTNGNYFSPDPNPFLHTWSLGVEEQVYLLLPTIIFLVAQLSRVRFEEFWLLISLISFSSFAALYILFHNGVVFFGIESLNQIAFYSTGTRVWEFGLGVLARTVITGKRVRKIGLATIPIVGFTWFALNEEFPIVFVLLSLSLSIEKFINYKSKSIMWHFFKSLGDRSYSLYLVHFPIYYLLTKAPGLRISNESARIFLYFLLTVCCAEFQFKFIELKYRNQLRKRPAFPVILVLLPLIVATVQLGEYSSKFFANTVPPKPISSSTNWQPGCHALTSNQPCVISIKKRNILLIGDSHAAMFAKRINEISRKIDYGFIYWTRSGCGFALSQNGIHNDCTAHNLQVIDYIKHSQPDTIIISNVDSSHKSLEFRQNREWLKAEVDTALQLRKSIPQVVVLGPTPSYKASSILLRGKSRVEPFSDEKYLKANLHGTGVGYYSTLQNLCFDKECKLKFKSKNIYEDYDHLTYFGATKALSNTLQDMILLSPN